MRRHYERQRRFDCTPIAELELNLECRDEIIPILAGLQYLYACADLRGKLVRLVAEDINEQARRDVGRPGLDDWQIVVLAAVRLGCNYDYDKLQDLAENHRALRILLGLGAWGQDPSFGARRIRDTLCQLKPRTLEAMNHAIVQHGQTLDATAAQSVRVDSFVVETDVHYPSESTLIRDGLRKIFGVCVELAALLGEPGWRQSQHQWKKVKLLVRQIGKIGVSKSAKTKDKLKPTYQRLLDRAKLILDRAEALRKQSLIIGISPQTAALAEELQHWMTLTRQVCDVANRRVILEEKVPNHEKLFSLFEPHTQLYRRGKAQSPIQFGRQVLIVEDGIGFISHYYLFGREQTDPDVAVEQMRIAQRKHGGQIRSASFDRGFFSETNAEELVTIVKEPCLPPGHPSQYVAWRRAASAALRDARQKHSGIESGIGAMQSGNGLKRCRDHGELGFERYLGLAILGRNIHVLGKLIIARQDKDAAAAISKRQAA